VISITLRPAQIALCHSERSEESRIFLGAYLWHLNPRIKRGSDYANGGGA
jgi:hypothetical protein